MIGSASRRALSLLVPAIALTLAAPGAVHADPAPLAVPVVTAKDLGGEAGGRLLVFAQRVEPGAKPQEEVDTSPFDPTGTAVAALEVAHLAPGTPALVGTEADAFPTAWSKLAPGTYRLQAVLDRNHDYNYGGRGPGDLVSAVVEAALPGPVPTLTLSTEIPARGFDARLASLPADKRAEVEAGLKNVEAVDIPSKLMTGFSGRATSIKGWVALPPGYKEGKGTYPTAYSDGGFGSTLDSAKMNAAGVAAMMARGEMPPMIWVILDHHVATGTHEFADSANNGPWGAALTTEAIPALEAKYRMDARASGRFLNGHSSGGWSTLWLQVAYPKVFGGTWPTAPDASDFHDFTNIDIYAANANAYAGADGQDFPLIRDKGKVIATLKQFAQLEAALGAYGGQFASFDWVFSPRCPDGRPCPLFDRATGKIDPAVAGYWRDHYDIAHIVARDWTRLRPDLDGKIHLIVGDADTFYLDGPARRLKVVLDGLGAKSSFRFVPGRTHFDLYSEGDDRMALMKTIAKEMYAVARPEGAKAQ
ncbi:esterase family protein [Sphingopyxis sp. GW247-27LB]|uniref:alpha/beta hydrolase n=1 Tax=Sphingopyxis sp. GW247-27LB TaxID=2012632 RepID=UPI000BA6C1BD|nr:alpha/beta hydrolase-fold protein [Sphingopyxis sp. GW247-27LB]PAL20171.1 enterochelin esterase [Sphingopyxis sp. GW247-27LB]